MPVWTRPGPSKKGVRTPPKPGFWTPRPGSPVWGGPINHITPRIEPGPGVQNRARVRGRPEKTPRFWRTGSQKRPLKTPETGGFYMVFRKTRSKPAQGDPVFLVQQIRKPHFSNSRGVWNSGGTPFWGGPDRFLDPSGGVRGAQNHPRGGSKSVQNPLSKWSGFEKSDWNSVIFGFRTIKLGFAHVIFRIFHSKTVILTRYGWIFQ